MRLTLKSSLFFKREICGKLPQEWLCRTVADSAHAKHTGANELQTITLVLSEFSDG